MARPDAVKLKDISWEEAMEEVKGILGDFLPTRDDLIKFRPETSWFVNGLAEHHKEAHLGRVLVLAEILARVLIKNNEVGREIDREAIGWGAVFHDTQLNGQGYLEHGRAAADWVEGNWGEILPPETSLETVDVIKYICEWHISGDREIPEMTSELAVLKDADGLDRVRFVDERRLDISYLRFGISKDVLVPVAMRLFELTDKDYDLTKEAFDEVLDAGVEMGLIRT